MLSSVLPMWHSPHALHGGKLKKINNNQEIIYLMSCQWGFQRHENVYPDDSSSATLLTSQDGSHCFCRIWHRDGAGYAFFNKKLALPPLCHTFIFYFQRSPGVPLPARLAENTIINT